MCVINYTRTYYHENMIVVNITVNAIYGIILEKNSCIWHCFVKMAVYGCNIDKICHIQQITNKI